MELGPAFAGRRDSDQLGPGRRARFAGSSGFTLLEILVTLIIAPLIVGAVTVLLITIFAHETSVTDTESGSEDTQVASAVFLSDVQSASYITTQPTSACGMVGTQILGLKSQNNAVVTSYDLVANGSNEELVREYCDGGVTTVPAATTVISASVSPTLSVKLTCSLTTNCSPSTSWMTGAAIRGATLDVSELNTGVFYVVTATPRLWNAASEGGAVDVFPITPLTLLGSGSCPNTSLSLSGSATLDVEGGGAIDDESTCAPSITLSGSATVTTSELGVGDPTPSGAVSTSGSASAPSPTYEAPTGDPLASLVAPTAPSTTATGSCPAAGSSGTCTAGSFSAAVSISGSASVSFNAGTYVFTQPVTISGSADVVFGSGSYLFEGGLTISGSGSVSFGTGTYIFAATSSSGSALAVSGSATLSSQAGGVLFYVESGVVKFSGSGSISLTGLSAYDGVALWQAATDTNEMTLSGSSALSDTYGGVYAPSGEIVPSGSSALSAAFVVAEEVSFSGSSSLTVS